MNSQSLESLSTDAEARIEPPPRRLLLRVGVPIVVIVGVTTLLAVSAWDSLRPRVPVETVAVAVREIEVAATAELVDEGGVIQAPGWVEAAPYSTYVSALTEGIVADIMRLEGDRVEVGDPVAKLIPDDAQIGVARAEAILIQKRGALEVAEAILDAAAVERSELVIATRTVAVSKARRAELEADLAAFPARIAEVTANRDELLDEYDRKRGLVEEGAVAEGPVKRLSIRLKALDAKVEALGQEQQAVEAQVEAALAEEEAAVRNRELITHETLEFERAKASVTVAKGELASAIADRDAAMLRLDRCLVTSPVAGVVIERLTSPGSTIQFANGVHGAHILHVYDPGSLQIRADIPLADAANVGVGQDAEITVDLLPDRVFTGHVERFLHRADIAKNTVEAKITIDAPSPLLKPDMLARVRILPTNRSQTSELRRTAARVFVPQTAVRADGRVWVVADRSGRAGLARPRDVVVGPGRYEDWVEIEEGLLPGDVVILGTPPAPDTRVLARSNAEDSR